MNTLKLYQEEPSTNLEKISNAEALYKNKFPVEFKDFLLKNNGGIPYPSFPTIDAFDTYGLSDIVSFLSIGDIIVKKHQLLNAEHQEHHQNSLNKFGLKNKNLLTFAIGEEGWYFMDLSSGNLGQLYYCNYSGGDGIVKIKSKSFKAFIQSLGFPEWSENEYDPNFEFNVPYKYHKIFNSHLFTTESSPQIGLNHFKEVYQYFKNVPTPDGPYQSVIQFYVFDRLKLEYLLEKGCSTDGLLGNSRNIETTKYLINELGLNINKPYNDKYPLQSYLTTISFADAKNKYEHLDQILQMNLDIDWFAKVKVYDNSTPPTMKEKLQKLHEEYLKLEISDKKFWTENGKPSGHIPFKRSVLIERLLDIN